MVLATFVSLNLPARAQDARPGGAFARPGYPLGQFRAFPSVTIENVYADNIFASEDREVGDFFVSIIPLVALESTWSRHSLSASVDGRINRYADVKAENNAEYGVEARGRLDLAEQSALGAIFRQGKRTVGRADSENSGRTDPQQLDYFEGELHYDHGFARVDLGLRGFVDHLDFPDPMDAERDRLVFGGSSRLSHRISPAFSLFLEPDAEVVDYQQTTGDDGFEQDRLALGGFLGSKFDVSTIEGEVSLGVVHASFDETSFDDVTTTWTVRGIRDPDDGNGSRR